MQFILTVTCEPWLLHWSSWTCPFHQPFQQPRFARIQEKYVLQLFMFMCTLLCKLHLACFITEVKITFCACVHRKTVYILKAYPLQLSAREFLSYGLNGVPAGVCISLSASPSYTHAVHLVLSQPQSHVGQHGREKWMQFLSESCREKFVTCYSKPPINEKRIATAGIAWGGKLLWNSVETPFQMKSVQQW